MNVYTGAVLTIHGVLHERIEVCFNNLDGNIGLKFYKDDVEGVGYEESHVMSMSYAAALQLRAAIDTALAMRGRVITVKEVKNENV